MATINCHCGFCGVALVRHIYASTAGVKKHYCNSDCSASRITFENQEKRKEKINGK